MRAVPIVGDTFAIPLEGGQFTACRVLAVKKRAEIRSAITVEPTRPDDLMVLAVNADWIGREIPDVQDPALCSVLRLPGGEPSATWVAGALLPEDFVLIGNIPVQSGEENAIPESAGGWVYFRFQPRWLRKLREDIPPPPPPPPPKGCFILHRYNGDEVYRLESADIRAIETMEGVSLWFEVRADPENAQRCEDTEGDLYTSPNANVGIDLPELNVNELVGREFVIPGAKSDDEDGCMSLMYNYEHEVLNDNSIKVVSRDGDRFWLRWTAITDDVCFYENPRTQVEIEGEFVFKDIDKWTKA